MRPPSPRVVHSHPEHVCTKILSWKTQGIGSGFSEFRGLRWSNDIGILFLSPLSFSFPPIFVGLHLCSEAVLYSLLEDYYQKCSEDHRVLGMSPASSIQRSPSSVEPSPSPSLFRFYQLKKIILLDGGELVHTHQCSEFKAHLTVL